jgi:hypothetical protein
MGREKGNKTADMPGRHVRSGLPPDEVNNFLAIGLCRSGGNMLLISRFMPGTIEKSGELT